jgi:DNA-binding GntR family transcriptional regulator
MTILARCYSDDVYLAVKSKIIEGELEFGSRLHISDLADELGVSSTPVREALNRLSTSGLAEITAHKGVFVVDPTEQDVKELCDARLGLELHMAEAVIQNATPQQIESLRWFTTQTFYEATSVGFHELYAQISGNRVLQKFHSQVQGVITVLFGKAIRKSDLGQYMARHSEEEKQIVEAITAHDLVRLRETIRMHMKNLEEFILASKVVI